MKNTLKAFGIIVLLAMVGFSMAACGGGDDTVKGLSYKAKFDTTDYNGGLVHTYVLNHTYSEALSILKKEIGPNFFDAGILATKEAIDRLDNDYNRNWVIYQDCVGMKQYRLIMKIYSTTNTSSAGTGWNYPK